MAVFHRIPIKTGHDNWATAEGLFQTSDLHLFNFPNLLSLSIIFKNVSGMSQKYHKNLCQVFLTFFVYSAAFELKM